MHVGSGDGFVEDGEHARGVLESGTASTASQEVRLHGTAQGAAAELLKRVAVYLDVLILGLPQSMTNGASGLSRAAAGTSHVNCGSSGTASSGVDSFVSILLAPGECATGGPKRTPRPASASVSEGEVSASNE